MEDYGSNAKNAQKAEEAKKDRPKLEQITESVPQVKKKGLGQKMKSLVAEADFRGAVRYVVHDVLIPATRNLIVDASTRGIERVMYGPEHTSRRGSGTSYSYGPMTSYNRPPSSGFGGFSSSRNAPPINANSRTSRSYQDDVILSSRADAERVLDMLKTIIDQCDFVSVGDLRDMCGLASTHTDQLWGWVNLIGVNIRQIREGFIIELPPVESAPR